MARQKTLMYVRRIGGRRKSRVKVGPLPALVFIALCLFSAVVGMMIDRAAERYEATQRPAAQKPSSKDFTGAVPRH